MSIIVSNSSPVSSASSAAANASSNVKVAAPQPSAGSPAYVVKLTVAQEVGQLYQQGQQVSQIASNLSLTESSVNSYLGLTSGK